MKYPFKSFNTSFSSSSYVSICLVIYILQFLLCKKSIEQGLEVIESTNLKYFTKEMTAEFYALKGMFLAQINKYV